MQSHPENNTLIFSINLVCFQLLEKAIWFCIPLAFWLKWVLFKWCYVDHTSPRQGWLVLHPAISCHSGVGNTLLVGQHFKKKWAPIMKSLSNTDTLFHTAFEPFEDSLTKFLEIILNWLWRVSQVYTPNMTAIAEAGQQGLWLDWAPRTRCTRIFSCLSSSPLALLALHWWYSSGSLLGVYLRQRYQATQGLDKEPTIIRNCLLFLQLISPKLALLIDIVSKHFCLWFL